MFQDGIERNQNGGRKYGGENIFDGLWFIFKMGHESIVERNVRDGGHKTAMEAGVVSPETGMGVDGKYRWKNLRGEEEQNGKVKGSFGDLEFFIVNGFGYPRSGY